MSPDPEPDTDEELPDPDDRIEWVTPDDVTVHFDPAGVGARIGAVVFDAMIIVLTLIVLGFILRITTFITFSVAPMILFLILSFVLRIGYWIWFEWRWMGKTPGKYLAGIQVLGSDGGSLTLSAIVTRNLLREVELWIPISILLMLRAGQVEQPLFLWCLGFLVIPLISRSNRRLGDYVAGTVVVNSPERIELNQDLLNYSGYGQLKSSYAFTRDMLDVYGIVQLNALQDVLEQHLFNPPENGPQQQSETLYEIKDRVVDRIDYPENVPDSEAIPFLQQFYRAMRRHLEGKLASGEAIRTEIKEDTETRGSSQAVERLARKYRLPQRNGAEE